MKSKHGIHRETKEGWRSIFYPTEGNEVGYHDEGIIHQPGAGYTWQVVFSQAGLAHEIKRGFGSLGVCTPLKSGTYRFIYAGLGWERENEDDSENGYALGVRFSVSND